MWAVIYCQQHPPPHISVLQLLLIATAATIVGCVWLLLTCCCFQVASGRRSYARTELLFCLAHQLVGVLVCSSVWVNASPSCYQCECWHVAPCGSMSAPQPEWVLTCSSLWVNVSSSTSVSVDMWLLVGQCQLLNQQECWHVAPCESMSAPQPVWVLTCSSLWINSSSPISGSVDMWFLVS